MTLFLLIVCGLLAYYAGKNSNKGLQESIAQQIKQNNLAWVEYIKAFKNTLTKKEDKKGLDMMLEDLQSQGYEVGELSDEQSVSSQSATDYSVSLIDDVEDMPLSSEEQKIKNASMLLYLGSFLLTVSIGLFLALGGFSGGVKTFLVGLIALGFYGGGLILYKHVEKFKSVGQTFLAIGMVLLPLVGMATYKFVYDSHNGPVVWFVTSLITLLLYFYAYYRTKTNFVGYFYLLGVLSLAESSASVIDMPTYYFATVMGLVAVVFMMYVHFFKKSDHESEMFIMSSGVFMPVSILMAFYYSFDFGARQLGLTLILASGYYLISSFYYKSNEYKAALNGLSLVLLVVSLGLFVNSFYSGGYQVLVAIDSLALLSGLGLYNLVKKVKISLPQTTTLASIVALIPYMALFWTGIDSGSLTSTISIVISMILAILMYILVIKLDLLVALGLTGVILVPLASYRLVEPAVTNWVMSYVYMAIAFVLASARYFIKAKTEDFKEIWITYIYISTIVALLFASMSGMGAVVAVLATVVITSLGLLLTEKNINYLSVAQIALYLGVITYWRWVSDTSLSVTVPATIAVVAGLIYAVAIQDRQDSSPLKHMVARNLEWGSVVAMFLAGFLVPFLVGGSKAAPICIIVGSLMLFNSARNYNEKDISLISLMVGVQVLLKMYHVENFLIYTHLWGLLFAFMAYWKRKRGEVSDQTYEVIAMCFLTIPLVFRALGSDGAFYSWLLLAESLAIALVGYLFNKQLVLRWGITVIIGSVLYQMRSYKYVALGLVGIGVIAFAIYMINKSHQDYPGKNKQH